MLQEMQPHLSLVHIHQRKEIENYLLDQAALDLALERAIRERANRKGVPLQGKATTGGLLEEITLDFKDFTRSQYIAKRIEYFANSRADTSTVTAKATSIFNQKWAAMNTRLQLVPGKKVLAALRSRVRDKWSVNLTDHRIVMAMQPADIPEDLREFLKSLDAFRSQ